MPKFEQKQVVINEIKEKIDKAKSIVLVDARGLNVAQDTALRKKFRDLDVDYKVYKNTIMNLAVKDTKFEGISEYLSGPNAFAFSYEDPMAAARTVSKELKALQKLEFKAGVVEGNVYDAAGILAIAEIPSREELLSKLLGSFKAPMSAFARLVNAVAEKNQEEAV